MTDSLGQNPPAIADGVASMITTVGRDEAWTGRTMAELFQMALTRNLTPVTWHVGFFVLRDLVRARDPLMRHKNRMNRPDTVWGCGVCVVSLQDQVALYTIDGNGKSFLLVAKE